jgi:hypothetical protein
MVVVLVACGSSSNNNNDYASCLAQGSSANAQQCADCTTSSCSSQVSAFESACPTYLACECPNGMPVMGSAGDACGSDLTGTCLDAALTADNCEHTMCAAQCGSGGFGDLR